jgi:ATP-dependent DNA ligase
MSEENILVKPQLCSNGKNIKKIPEELHISTKIDGNRLLFKDAPWTAYTRNRKDKSIILKELFQYETMLLIHELKNLTGHKNIILDGELVLLDDDGKFIKIQELTKLINKKNIPENIIENENVKYMVFDYYDGGHDTAFTRMNNLKQVFDDDINYENISKVEGGIYKNMELQDLKNLSILFINKGFEGIVCKSNAVYKPGSRNKTVFKFKNDNERMSLTCLLTGYELGEGRFENTYSKLTWSVKDEYGNLKELTRATSGLSNYEINDIDNQIKQYLNGKGDKPDIKADILFEDYIVSDNNISLKFPIIDGLRFAYDIEYVSMVNFQNIKDGC